MLAARPVRESLLLAVRLVHDERVGELEHAALQALQLVTGAGLEQDAEEVHERADGDLRLPDPDRLDDDHAEARRLAEEERLARPMRHAAERAARRRRANEGALLQREPLHARLVAEDAPARHRARRIHRQHGDAMAQPEQVQAERLDEGRLAHARRTREAHPDGAARRGHEAFEHLLPERLPIGRACSRSA